MKKGNEFPWCGTKKWKTKGLFYITKNISEHVKLVQFVYTVGNVNHAVSIAGNWIFYSNDEKSLPLSR